MCHVPVKKIQDAKKSFRGPSQIHMDQEVKQAFIPCSGVCDAGSSLFSFLQSQAEIVDVF